MTLDLAPQDWFEIVWAAFVSFAVLIGFLFTINRRNLHPLKQRSLILISATPVITVITGISIIFRSTHLLPCFVTRFGIYLILVTFVITWLTTTYRTYFRWRIEQGKLTLTHNDSEDYEKKAIGTFVGELDTDSQSSSDSNDQSVSWFVKHRRLISESFLMIILFVQITIFMGFYFLAAQIAQVNFWGNSNTDPYAIGEGDCGYRFEIFSYILLVVYGVGWIIRLALAFRKHLKGVHDGLRLKRDLVLVFILWPVTYLVSVVCSSVVDARLGETITLMAAYLFTFFGTTGLATLETYKGQKFKIETSKISNKDTKDINYDYTLLEVLEVRETRDQFLFFLKGEWSAENLLFWEEVQRLHTITDPKLLQREIFRIHDKYFTPHSIYELNLPHNKVSQIHQLIKDALTNPGVLHPEVYDEIQAMIFTQMQFNSFMRFKSAFAKKPKISARKSRIAPESPSMATSMKTFPVPQSQPAPVTVVLERPRISSGIPEPTKQASWDTSQYRKH